MTNSTKSPTTDVFLDRRWNLSIGGQLTPAQAGDAYPIENPSTGDTIAWAPDGTSADANAAVSAALVAREQWAGMKIADRARLIVRLAETIDRHAEELAQLDAVCYGGPITQMRKDVANAADALRYFAGISPRLTGETLPASGNLHFTERVPFGVVVRIVAFNHPFMFTASRIAAPLIAGNTVIVKPPETAPLSALRFGELVAEILPPGVLSIVVGNGPQLPRTLVCHSGVRRIGFIGSDSTGRAIQGDASRSGVKFVTLELGGKNALIGCEDSDVNVIADQAVRGMNFAWSGQSCGSTSRLLVHNDIADDVVAAVVDRVKKLRIGAATDEGTEMGPLVSARQYAGVEASVSQALEEGASLACGGRRAKNFPHGHFFEPTILDQVSPAMHIAEHEVFGPVLSVMRWTDESEAVSIANSVDYGLTGAVFTRDIDRALRIARALEAGYVWVNGTSDHFPGVPYGGTKNSGFGRDGDLEELLSYTQTKATNVYLSQ